MERKLASIQRIISLKPIEGADRLEVATVLGWQVIVRKGEFKPGDLCVYVEVDSILPDRPWSEFLRPRGFRIKTIKLKGQISQGICFPVSILEGEVPEEGTEVTEKLGITKYEPPVPHHLEGQIKGNRPDFVPKTDEVRIQTVPRLVQEMSGVLCYVTEKLNGSSVSFFLKDGEFGLCSRRFQLLETKENAFWQAAHLLRIEDRLRDLGQNIVLQGELVGPRVQKNYLKLPALDVYFFNAVAIDERRFLNAQEFFELIKSLGLKSVPVLRMPYVFNYLSVDEIVKDATRTSVLNPEALAEGIVIRPMQERYSQVLRGRMSFKAINPEQLLKEE